MTDMAEFSQAGFDPKAWINAACTTRPQEESLERFLAELEMKLQLTAEDVESALEANSNRLIQRIPPAVLEVVRVKGDVGALQGDTRRIFEQIGSSHMKAAAAVAPLASLDVVKSRMEGACNTLREATELSSLFAGVEEVFATGNLPRVAEVLSTMRRSLAAVGDVPEFNDGWKQLESLENRLLAMVEGPLAGAMAHKKSDMVRQLVDILVAVDRSAVVEKHYVAARMAPLLSFWEALDRPAKDQQQQQQQQQHEEHGGDFVAWLPRFYDEVLLGVEGEARWCAAVLPDLHPTLLLSMLRSLFTKVSRSYAKRLQAAVEPAGAVQPSSLANVMAAQAAAVHFSRSLLGTLGGSGLLPKDQASILISACLEPFTPYLSRYSQLEGSLLSNEVVAIAAHTAMDEELDSVVACLADSVPHMIQSVEHAVERCLKFTGGAEIGSLLRVGDEALTQFCIHLMTTVAAIRKRCLREDPAAPTNPKGADGGAAEEDGAWGAGFGDSATKDVGPGEEAGAVVQLLGVSASLVGQLGVLEAQMHTVVAQAAALAAKHRSPAEAPLDAGAIDPAEVAVASRIAAEPRLVSALSALAEQVQDQRYNALPSSTQRASSFQQAVHSLLYDTLTFKVAEELKSIPGLGSWTEEAGDNAFNLPSFSAYPLGYASAVGEYLMTLPQLLEAWMPSEESEEPSHIDAEWLDKVATGTAELYTKQLLTIPKLSSKGAQQLAADLEYFCNVLSALSVAVPPDLATIQLGAGLPESDYGPAAADALQQPFIDRRVFDQVLSMRGMSSKE